MAQDSETLLAEKAKAGCKDSGSLLWSRQRRWLATVLLAHMPREAEIDDLLQEVALRYWAKLSSLEQPAKFRAWLRVIAVNVARSFGRTAQSRNRVYEALDEDLIVDLHVAADRERSRQRERSADILELCRGLPASYREPLLLKALEGLSQKQIAQVLDIAPSAVGTRLARGRRMLREEIARALEPGGGEQRNCGARPMGMGRPTCTNGRSRS